MHPTAMLAVLATLALSAAPLAAEGREGGCPKGGELRAKVLERFDANQDGKLDEAERAAAKAARQEHRGELVAKVLAKHPELDGNGDGKLSKEECEAARARRQAACKEKHPEAFARIDTNGDGAIDESERKAAKARFLANHPGADQDGDGRLDRRECRDGRKDGGHADNGRRAHGEPAGNGHDHGRRGKDGK